MAKPEGGAKRRTIRYHQMKDDPSKGSLAKWGKPASTSRRGLWTKRSSVEQDRTAIRALGLRALESKQQLKADEIREVVQEAKRSQSKRSQAQRDALFAGARIVVQLTKSPTEFKGIQDALRYFDFRTDRDRRPGTAKMRPFTLDTARNAEALGGLVRIVYVPPKFTQSNPRSIGRMNTVESYGDRRVSDESFMGDRLELDDSAFISVERGLGVTTLAWTTPLPLGDVLRLLGVDANDGETLVRVSRLNAAGDQAPPASEPLSELVSAPDGVVYTAVPCSEFTFIWKASPKTLQGLGGLAEIALVYDSESAQPERHFVRDLGSIAMEQAFALLADHSKLLGG
jgi:hypothetical protein